MTKIEQRPCTIDSMDIVKSGNYPEVLGHLKENGVHIFGEILSREKATDLFQLALSRKILGPHIFLSEQEYVANPTHFGVNPARGANNLLEQFNCKLSFVEQDLDLTGIMENLLGRGYEIFLKKFVCGVPSGWIPDWLKGRLENAPINNLGAFVRPEYRDITYFVLLLAKLVRVNAPQDIRVQVVDYVKGRQRREGSISLEFVRTLNEAMTNCDLVIASAIFEHIPELGPALVHAAGKMKPGRYLLRERPTYFPS